MKEKHIYLALKSLLFFGVVLISIGLGLILFSPFEYTTHGIYLIASLFAIGMLIALPTKLFIVFHTLTKKDEAKSMRKLNP